MDFSGVTNDTSVRAAALVEYILELDLAPDDKIQRIADAMNAIGEHFHSQLYGAASEVFDSSAMKTGGLSDADGQTKRLATKIVRNYALSREISPLVDSYYSSVLGSAQSEAFDNAKSMQKHPTLTRIIRGETCPWCISKAGTHVDPKSEDFARHRDDDCLFIVGGFNTRNGVLKNYTKRG